MFLQAVAARNPLLLQWAAASHRMGLIPPDTHVLDLDALEANARLTAAAAGHAGLGVYFMAKQLGRNPAAVARILAGGLQQAVAVDLAGALALHPLGVRIGHLGHLVQIPEQDLDQALDLQPEIITVYSYAKAASISRRAAERGERAELLLRVVAPGDFIFPGQEGGIPATEVAEVAVRIERLPGVQVVGVTTFPCLGYDRRRRRTEVLPNAMTAARAAMELAVALGRPMTHLILPGMNTSSAFPLLRELGATHVEPGHALTGTTPLHARGREPEVPAMVYVSEVSHCHGDAAYCYAAGLYRRSQAAAALVGTDPGAPARWPRHRVSLPGPGHIWYYAALRPADGRLPRVGETVLMAPRTQLFNVRSHLAVLARTPAGGVELTLFRPGDLAGTPATLAQPGPVTHP